MFVIPEGNLLPSLHLHLLFLTVALLDEDHMPYINLQMIKCATPAQKAQIVAEFTDTLVRILNKDPEHTHIVIQEIEPDDWGSAGLLNSEHQRRSSNQ